MVIFFFFFFFFFFFAMWNMGGSNRLCSDRELIKKHEIHLKHIKNIRSNFTLRGPAPRTASFKTKPLSSKQSRISTQEKERKIQIFNDNHNLLQKIMKIDKRKPPNYLDKKSLQSFLSSFHSLHYVQKKKKGQEITESNARFLKQLMAATPTYQKSLWKQQYRQHKKISKNLSSASTRFLRNDYFVRSAAQASADKEVSELVHQIIRRRYRRLGGSGFKPQSANPEYYNPREQSSEVRPCTSGDVFAHEKETDPFPSPPHSNI
eukprot:TRINITY_DN4670_c0_g1_i1.p1 TRINITY_DN4670_c0_g1~~TRINITY_DN4670_c0_g1_i1.p1  ORF type:complete len:263 (+),score=47.49 TRINITY_DN4670_c0_g1_i1:86-874(+)